MKKLLFLSIVISIFINIEYATEQNVVFAEDHNEHVYVNNHSVFSIEFGAGGLYSRSSLSKNWIYDFQCSLESSSCNKMSGILIVKGFVGYQDSYDFGTSDAVEFNTNKTIAGTKPIGTATVPIGTNPPGTNPNINFQAGDIPVLQMTLIYNNKCIYRNMSKEDLVDVKNKIKGDVSIGISEDVFIDTINSQGIKVWGSNMLIALCKNICKPKDDESHKRYRRNQVCSCSHINVGIVGGFIWDNFEIKSIVQDENKYGLWKKTSAKDWVVGIRISGDIKIGSISIIPSVNIMGQVYPKTTVTGSVPEIKMILLTPGTPASSSWLPGFLGGTSTPPAPAIYDPITYTTISDTIILDRQIRVSIIGDVKMMAEMIENTYIGLVPFVDWNWRALKDKQVDIIADGYKVKNKILEDNIKFGLNVVIHYMW